MQQAAVAASSPVLHAADQMRSDAGDLVLPRRGHRCGQKHVAEPVPLALVAEQVRLVRGDFLQEGVPLGVVGGGSRLRWR